MPVDGRKRYRGTIEAVTDDVAPSVALRRVDAKPGELEIVDLPLASIADGRLVLTDELIRETLRAAKAADDAADAGDEAAPAAPAKGPGRFAARNAAKATPRPNVPAGVHGGFKRSPPSPGARKAPR